ncbi:MAG: hypothetical protein KJO42_14320 [Silicimonas sp.]|nr:hypothetical protein [Silicimonas sp.]NNF92546.1 hypothetical protein [Boseongicola sp.]NNL47438.1 hypothetical protein [Acidimicrobiia bacterium]RZW00675.1 MAG: hypothetical protein EX266_13735 [Paracoccaceae bacterium]NND18755.1 hypothetical protein [Silicimonas sp.]
MKRILLAIPLVLSVAACDSTAGNVAGGAAIGAAVADDDDRLEGAAIGAAAGAVVSAAQQNANTCRYRNTRTGEVFTAPCGSY